MPGNPDQSLLWLVVAKKTLTLSTVDVLPMPQDGLPLSRENLEGLRRWILAGAPQAGVVDGVADLIDPCPPQPQDEDDISGLPQCKWGDPKLLLPSLSADPPADLRVFTRNGKRRIEFTTRVANTGDGPLIIQAATLNTPAGHTVDAMQVILRSDGSKCVHRAATMRRTGEGSRWQYGNFADFELRQDDPANGPVLATASKPAFCLVDSDPIRGFGDRPHQYELHCTDPIGRMGISVGYTDTYSQCSVGFFYSHLGIFGFAQDIDIPSRKFHGKPDILTSFADSKGELLIIDDDHGGLCFLINTNFIHHRRT